MFRLNSYMPRLCLKLQGIKYGKNLQLIGWPMIFVKNGGWLELAMMYLSTVLYFQIYWGYIKGQ